MQTLPGSPALIAPVDGVAYVRGATDVPLSEDTIGQFLRDTALRFPDRPAVVFRVTEEDIRDFCRGQIAHYKIPRYVRFVDEMPLTVTGKVQKFAMREEMIRSMKLSEKKTA